MAKTILFESKYTELILVRQHKRQTPIPDGSGWHTIRENIEYRFHPESSPRGENGWVGVLRVKEGQDKLATDSDRWLAPGEEVGVERDAVKALMAHRSFGTKFWLVGHAPGTQYPRPEDWRKDVVQASVALDADTLERMIREEKGSHGRADLISEAELALSTVRDARAELEATAEKAQSKPAAKPKATA